MNLEDRMMIQTMIKKERTGKK